MDSSAAKPMTAKEAIDTLPPLPLWPLPENDGFGGERIREDVGANAPMGQEQVEEVDTIDNQHSEDTTQDEHHVSATNEAVLDSAYNLSRAVNFYRNAWKHTQQTMRDHETAVQHQMTEFYAQTDLFSTHSLTPTISKQEIEQILVDQALKKVRRIQVERIEPIVGPFGHNDNVYIHRFPRFEDRLLAVLYIGLLRQEFFGAGCIEKDGRAILDKNGSCLMEARVWQLEILKSWTRQVRDEHQ